MYWCRKSSRRGNLSCSAGQDVTPVEKQQVDDVDLNNKNEQELGPVEAMKGDPVLKFVKATNALENEVGSAEWLKLFAWFLVWCFL